MARWSAISTPHPKQVLERLTNGSLEAEERHALARTLIRLLPLVADDLQNQEDIESATRLAKHLKRWDVEAEAAQRLDVAEAKGSDTGRVLNGRDCKVGTGSVGHDPW